MGKRVITNVSILDSLEIDSVRISDSLASGIARRVFKDAEHFINRRSPMFDLSKPYTVGYLFNYTVERLKPAFNTMESNLQTLREVINASSQPMAEGPIETNIVGCDTIDTYLYVVFDKDNHAISPIIYHVNKNSPLSSKAIQHDIGFSEHAVARVLYRIHPDNLAKAFYLLFQLTLHQNQQDYLAARPTSEYWVYIPDVGAALFRRSSITAPLILVTFVDENLLRDDQREEFLNELKDSHKDLSATQRSEYSNNLNELQQLIDSDTIKLPIKKDPFVSKLTKSQLKRLERMKRKLGVFKR